MTVADMKAAVALAVEQALRLVQADDAPVAVAEPPKPARKGRTLSEEQKRKMAEGRKRAAAAKAAPAKPAPKAAKPVAAVKAAKPDRLTGWDVTKHTTKRGKAGKIVRVGPFSMFIEDGDAEKRAAAIEAINKVFRSQEIHAVVKQF